MLRVVLINMGPKLRSILSDAVTRQADMKLIPYGTGNVASSRPDVIVYEIEHPGDPTVPERLLRAVPRARVLMIADAGDHAALYELRPTRKVLAQVSMKQVIDAIRFGLEEKKKPAIV